MATYSLARSGSRFRLVSTWWNPDGPGSCIVATIDNPEAARLVAAALSRWSANLWIAASVEPHPDPDPKAIVGVAGAAMMMRRWFEDDPVTVHDHGNDVVEYRQVAALLPATVRNSVLEEAKAELAAAGEASSYLAAGGPYPANERGFQYASPDMASRISSDWMWPEKAALDFSYLAKVDPAYHPVAIPLVEAVTRPLGGLAAEEWSIHVAPADSWLAMVVTTPRCRFYLWSGPVPHVTFQDESQYGDDVSLFRVERDATFTSRDEVAASAEALQGDGFLDADEKVPAEGTLRWAVTTRRSAAVRAILEHAAAGKTSARPEHVATAAVSLIVGAYLCVEEWGYDGFTQALIDESLYFLPEDIDEPWALYLLVSEHDASEDWAPLLGELVPAAMAVLKQAASLGPLEDQAVALFIEVGLHEYGTLTSSIGFRHALSSVLWTEE